MIITCTSRPQPGYLRGRLAVHFNVSCKAPFLGSDYVGIVKGPVP